MTNLIKSPDANNLPSVLDHKKKKLTFYGENIPSTDIFTMSELIFLETINFELIKDIPDDKLLDLVFIIVSNSLRSFGSRMSAEDQVLLSNDLKNELTDDFSQLSIREVELIAKNGIRNKYETGTVGFSIVNFNLWSAKYLEIKFKRNTQISQKLIKAKSINLSPVKKTTKADLIMVIREHYGHIKNNYDNLHPLEKNKIDFDNYWIKNGLITSSGYLFTRLKKFKLITQSQLKKEMDGLNSNQMNFDKKEEFTTFQNIKAKTIKSEAERIVCCKLALKLRTQNKK